MTLQEVSKKYDIAESTIKANFKRVQQQLFKKYGINLVKEGRGDNVVYYDDSYGYSDNFYEAAIDEVVVDQKVLSLVNWEFVVFLAVVLTPETFFRGSQARFLRQMHLQPTEELVKKVKQTLESLGKKCFLMYIPDPSDESYFVATMYHAVEEEMHIGVSMIKMCKQWAEEERKQDWVPLFKVWIAVQLLENQKTITNQQIADMTGLTVNKVSETNRLLQKKNAYQMTKCYKGRKRCIGQSVNLTGMVEENWLNGIGVQQALEKKK